MTRKEIFDLWEQDRDTEFRMKDIPNPVKVVCFEKNIVKFFDGVVGRFYTALNECLGWVKVYDNADSN